MAEWSEPEYYLDDDKKEEVDDEEKEESEEEVEDDDEKEEEMEEIRTVSFVEREEALDLRVRRVQQDELKKKEQMRTEAGQSSPLDLRKVFFFFSNYICIYSLSALR